MKSLAVIAEYNPFHNGHRYHLNKALEQTGADYSIALMSGNFLQRGVPAMWNKFTRSKMSTMSGFDLTLELPFPYATGSARDFAMGAVSIINLLNSVDYLCFGAETDDLFLLQSIADIINTEPKVFKDQLTNSLASGLSYPQARAKALNSYFQDKNQDLSYIISQPNNILAIEYLAALMKINSNIKPIIIKRTHAMYHDNTLYGSISSASAIREHINSCNDFDIGMLKNDLPDAVYSFIQPSYMLSWPINAASLTPFLQYQLINSPNYGAICDISEEFANKLKGLSSITNYEDAINALTSKDITVTRARRNIIHLIMNYLEADRSLFIENGYGLYASILSFRRDSSSLLKTINENSHIPLITKKADFDKYFVNYPHINYDIARKMYNYDIKATDLYNCLVYNTFNTTLPNEFNTVLPIV